MKGKKQKKKTILVNEVGKSEGMADVITLEIKGGKRGKLNIVVSLHQQHILGARRNM